ncbi:ABC transporter ATP-binding protein, partial [Rubrivirga sp.]|uniref:ABC transporter ATP-binding protein n=1 Tax=Rubrivirga sp. TaxID=1885344 RepID=UPI003C792081
FGSVVALVLSLIIRDGGTDGAGIAQSLPILGLFVFAGYRVLPTLQSIYVSLATVRLGISALEVVRKDLEEEHSLPLLPAQPPEAMTMEWAVELCDVSYRYPKTDQSSLRNIKLTIRRGQRVGIIGHTGSGKTTLMDVLLGLLVPTSGEVLVDGKPLDDNSMRAWRGGVGYVAQDMFLSDTSVARNIAFGCPPGDVDLAEVERAARMAQIHDFVISELPDGYETEVGEDGVRLSGGQRQRIGIARALYGGAEVLVFDEATSALDTETEAMLMAEIDRLAQNRTVIIVAHRMSTLRDCDMIVRLEAGRIVSVGGAEIIEGPSIDGDAALEFCGWDCEAAK